MGVVSKSIPGLFGGVSQQIPALRHPTQGSRQDNGLSTTVDGLMKRPGSVHVATLALTHTGGLSVANSGGNVATHVIDRGALGRHQLIVVNGNLMLYDLVTGAQQTVNSPDGFNYLLATDPSTAFRFLTVADFTFIVNTTRTVTMTGASSPANPANVHYVNIRTAVQKVTYTVNLGGAVIRSHYSGDTPTNQTIAMGLAQAVNGQNGYTAFVVPGTNMVRIQGSAPFTCAASDDWGNAAIQCVSNGVDKYSDLPARFEAGFVVTIKGTEGAGGEYYVQWNGKGWEETMAPGLPTTFEPSSMPHQLRPNGDGTWTFERAPAWEPRKVGDNISNPLPSFVGQTIRGAFFHRNRLGLLSRDNVVMSRPGDYFAYWATTVQQTLATDPIDLSASHEGVESLDWAVGYNKALLLWSSGPQQFTLVGGDVLTADTARIVPTTAYATDTRVRPVAIGNRALYASLLGSWSSLALYQPSADRQSDSVQPLTDHCPEYVPAGIRQMAVSTTVKAASVTPQGLGKDIFLFKYEQDERNEELTQKAWQRFTLERAEKVRVLHTHWVDRVLYVLVYTQRQADGTNAGHFALERIDMGPKADPFGMGFGLRLDRQVSFVNPPNNGTQSWFDLPYPAEGALTVLLRRTGLEPLEYAVANTSTLSTTSTRVFVNGVLPAGTYVVGQRYTFVYEFTEGFMQDRNGTPLMASELKHVRTLLRYVDTGYFRAEVDVHLRGTYTYPFVGRIVGQPGQGPSQLALSTGTFAIPVHSRANHVKVRLVSDSYFPCLFPYAEMVGDATVKANR